MKLIKSVFNYSVFIAIFLFVSFTSSGQTDTSAISGKFDYYRQNVLQEKIFVHTDKPFYFAGEILWFKIYNVDGTFHKPVDVSKVAYIELLDKENKPCLQAKIALNNGSGSGSFYLPLSVVSGNFKLRAYTNWMKNFSSGYFFEKDIPIVNTLKPSLKSIVQKVEKYDIQFFPEGGNLVRAVQSKIAFRAVNSSGQGINFTGTIVDENNTEVARFRPLIFGIGNFLFTPDYGHSYKAIIIPDGKDPVIKELPRIFEKGYVMHISDTTNGTITLTIKTNTNLSAPSVETVFLFVHTRQMIKIADKMTLRNGNADYTFSKDLLGEGISHFTLFNSEKQPLCERLYFKWPKKKLGIETKTSMPQYSQRDKVNLEILSRNAEGTAEAANLSLAVYKYDSLQSIDPQDIFSYLWLSSDLKGAIESPGYYFKNSGAGVNEAMDNLMLTHGWSRFRWEDLLQNKIPAFEFLPEYEGHIISGKITDIRTNNPAGNIPTYLSAPGNRFQLYNCTSNDKGQLNFYTHKFYKSGEIIVQPGCESEAFYKLEINSPFAKDYSPDPFPDFRLSGTLSEEIRDHSINMQVQNIFSGKALSRYKEPIMDSLAFYEKPDLKYFLDDYTRFGTMEEVIREYVNGVFLHKKKNNFHVELADIQQHASFGEEPLVLFDGIPTCNFNEIIEYDPLQVKKIEIVNKKYYFGTSEFSGIINFTTYKGNYADYKMAPGALVLDYEGLQKQREFYSPVYETGNTVSNRLPDFRNLLYWSPEITTNNQGKAKVTFYTGDQTGEYLIMVQGISAIGDAGSRVTSIIVKSPENGLK